MGKPVYILNGPNLNLLGVREPEIYGSETLDGIRQRCEAHAEALGLKVDFRQSNHEGELVDWVQQARSQASALIINAGAYTHTSVALLDAILASDLPVVEVHLSNIHQREEFRRHSYISTAANGVICGFGAQVYDLALDALAPHIDRTLEV